MVELGTLVGKDILGRELRVGDYIANACRDSYKNQNIQYLAIYRIIDYCFEKLAATKRPIRVQIIQGKFAPEEVFFSTWIGRTEERSIWIPNPGLNEPTPR
jgi:hypothetical protein